MTDLTNLIRRRRHEWIMINLYKSALFVALGFLGLLFVSIAIRGFSALSVYTFSQTLQLPPLPAEPPADRQMLIRDYALNSGLQEAVTRNLAIRLGWERERLSRDRRRALNVIISSDNIYQIARQVGRNPAQAGQNVTLELLVAGDGESLIKKGVLNADYDLSQLGGERWRIAADILRQLDDGQQLHRRFNSRFFTGVDSRNAESAGILGAAVATVLTIAVMMALAVPVGVLGAIYLQELAGKNLVTGLVEALINNLAAVPSIVFGLMGLAVFLNYFGLPRSTPLVGGIVLALMTLPVIIIATRSALAAVPGSIREAALALGATRLQMVFHHVLPMSATGILTGIIVGLARAVGETAPLIMIGMMAFIAAVPDSINAPEAPLPMQIYLWSDNPERAFVDRTSLAILVLITVTISLNLAALLLRRRIERSRISS